MSSLVFLAVIAAAVLHASWNALVKGGADKTTSMVAVVLGQMAFPIPLLPFVSAPAAESYPYLAVGVVLHLGYQLFLLQSYKIGDLTQVYPIARGSAPLIVAIVSVGFLGVALSGTELLAILVIGCGIVSLALVRRRDGMRNGRAAVLALVTGGFIASYSLVDGLGARVAGTSLGFYAWLAVLNGVLMMLFLAVRAPHVLRNVAGPGRMAFALGGSASFVAYALVTWAFTQAPIALVTALRETSIIFALLIGVVFLRERLDLMKVVSTFITLIGAALLRFGKG
ncbi:DMT family transporter [Pacificoceanicola onchidii]|uniref:DMT family transporter n=1 Tax=Pacificoceanicola onchidii TaxID=2562685 RepID=UPI0010A49B73|nr:DMT family transporter [Pacificoceanicola onchidii]